ncbi:MAG: hypothetical protein BWX73_00109 [Lentisphaerae bacterium ADurb.Bin082]|nr:MAG: hypothetical protein BWX73_00109 [Lentisphaerae bacterium ADurb.Bin082]
MLYDSEGRINRHRCNRTVGLAFAPPEVTTIIPNYTHNTHHHTMEAPL